MMIDDKQVVLTLIALGMAVGFLLWALRLVEWWGILIGGVAAPAMAAILLGAMALASKSDRV